eukprot:6731272-Alexandrium_andersonii.AAC.1
MSASLVGSEMCIRDRSVSAPTRGESNGVARADRSLLELSSSGIRLPVSYTHLTLPTICSV